MFYLRFSFHATISASSAYFPDVPSCLFLKWRVSNTRSRHAPCTMFPQHNHTFPHTQTAVTTMTATSTPLFQSGPAMTSFDTRDPHSTCFSHRALVFICLPRHFSTRSKALNATKHSAPRSMHRDSNTSSAHPKQVLQFPPLYSVFFPRQSGALPCHPLASVSHATRDLKPTGHSA